VELITAKEALELAKKNIQVADETELEKVLAKIKEVAARGDVSVLIQRICFDTHDGLIALGYSIASAGVHRNCYMMPIIHWNEPNEPDTTNTE